MTEIITYPNITIKDKDSRSMIDSIYRISNVLETDQIAFVIKDTFIYFHETDTCFNKCTIMILDDLCDYEFDRFMVSLKCLFNTCMIPDINVEWSSGQSHYDQDTEHSVTISEYKKGPVIKDD